MSIVTIAHSAYSNGGTIASGVAGRLGYRCVDREVLIEASNRYGIPEAKYTEVLEAKGHWWERWHESLRLYRITLQAAMCEMAQGDKLVYHGRAGQQLLPNIRHVFRVMIVAPMDYRIGQLRTQRNLDPESARQYLQELDKVRGRRFRALFNEDWQDPVGYDVVLNSGRIPADSAVTVIADTIGREEFQPNAESLKAFQDLTTTARVQAALITSPKTRNVVLTVKSDGGRVSISGILADPELESEIVRIARSVTGVTEVITDIEPPPIEYMHP
jgi:cytidylate kinase